MSEKSLNRTIVHVDDDPSLLRIVAAKLNSLGYHVISVEDPRETLPILRAHDVQILLLDIDMPHINGLDLLKKVKQDDGGVQVIMLSGVVSMSTALRSLRWGAEACVFKPIEDFDTLLTAIDTTFGKIDRWWDCLEELKQRKSPGATKPVETGQLTTAK